MLKIFVIFGVIAMLLAIFYPRKVVYKPGHLRWNHFYLVGFRKDKKPDYFYIKSIRMIDESHIEIVAQVPKEYIDDHTGGAYASTFEMPTLTSHSTLEDRI